MGLQAAIVVYIQRKESTQFEHHEQHIYINMHGNAGAGRWLTLLINHD